MDEFTYDVDHLCETVTQLFTFVVPHSLGVGAHVHCPAVNTGNFRKNHKNPEQHQADHGQEEGQHKIEKSRMRAGIIALMGMILAAM